MRALPTLRWTVFALWIAAACASDAELRLERPLHTFSIVARDPQTGELGVAVQSHWFSVGSVVPWAEAGVGAIATQSFVNPAFGPDGLELLRQGRSPQEALKEMLSRDPGEAVRQVALIDARERVAVHTGSRCIAWAGHQTGPGYSVQANMMWNDAVVPAMARAYEAAKGLRLAERLLAALEAGQGAGGDIRGQQSAALLVVRAQATGHIWEDRLVDLRVEDHPRPVEELRRLYTVHEAYEHMNAGDAALERNDMEGALREYSAASTLDPSNHEIVFWTAFTLATNGRRDEALPLFRKVFADERWRELLRRLPAAQLVDSQTVGEILTETER